MDSFKNIPDNSVDSVVTDPPYFIEFMGKQWDSPGHFPQGVSLLDAWLVGFIAGEGCFRVQSHKNGAYYSCAFSIHMRDDETPTLRGLAARYGGRLSFHGEVVGKSGVKSNPGVRWIIDTKEGCLNLTRTLDRVPMFAKKANDYRLWRRAVELWNTTERGSRWGKKRDVSEIASIHKELQSIRRYDSEAVDFPLDPFAQPIQAFHEKWAREAFRVLKPGGYLLSFSAAKTYHRLACAVEDAGFEVKDQIMWLYSTGMPKGQNISKAVDKTLGAERTEIIGKYQPPGMDKPWNLSNATDTRNVGITSSSRNNLEITAPASEQGKQWNGWHSQIKPAHEPIVMARKPFKGTLVHNILIHGTGALNIDGCRVPTSAEDVEAMKAVVGFNKSYSNGEPGLALGGSVDGSLHTRDRSEFDGSRGRFPANVIHDGSDEVEAAFAAFGQRPGQLAKAKTSGEAKTNAIYGNFNHVAGSSENPRNDSGTASRFFAKAPFETEELAEAQKFFYSAKAKKKDRDGSGHPTIKPIALMRYLTRLVTPPGGAVLDPFAGSGTTGQAAIEEGFNVILMEREAEYCADIERRIGKMADKADFEAKDAPARPKPIETKTDEAA